MCSMTNIFQKQRIFMEGIQIRSKWMGVKSFHYYNNRIIYVIPQASKSFNGFFEMVFLILKKISFACSLLHWVFIWNIPSSVNVLLKNNRGPVWKRGRRMEFLWFFFSEIAIVILGEMLSQSFFFISVFWYNLWCYIVLQIFITASNLMHQLPSGFICHFEAQIASPLDVHGASQTIHGEGSSF